MSFFSPKTSSAPPPPVIADTSATQQDYADQLRHRQGRAAAILTQTGQQPQTASKTLLGG